MTTSRLAVQPRQIVCWTCCAALFSGLPTVSYRDHGLGSWMVAVSRVGRSLRTASTTSGRRPTPASFGCTTRRDARSSSESGMESGIQLLKPPPIAAGASHLQKVLIVEYALGYRQQR